MLKSASRHRAALAVGCILVAVALGVPVVNANAGPPRALFLALPADLPEPRVSLSAAQDSDGSWRLKIDATDFQFTDLCVANAAAMPRGHAHVIEGDAKRASAYAPELILGHLAPGRHEFRVVLRGQDHRAMVGRGGMIEASLVLSIPPV
jgi:hypothetical protein